MPVTLLGLAVPQHRDMGQVHHHAQAVHFCHHLLQGQDGERASGLHLPCVHLSVGNRRGCTFMWGRVWNPGPYLAQAGQPTDIAVEGVDTLC